MTLKATDCNELYLAGCDASETSAGEASSSPRRAGAGQGGDHRADTHLPGEYRRTQEDVAAYLTAAIKESASDPRVLMKAFRSGRLRDLRAEPDSAAGGTA